MATRRGTTHPENSYLKQSLLVQLISFVITESGTGGGWIGFCANVKPSEHALGPGCVETEGTPVLWKQTRLLLAHHLELRNIEFNRKCCELKCPHLHIQ